MEQFLKIAKSHFSVLIRVNNLKGLFDFIGLDQKFAIETSSDEILEVNLSISIQIALLDDLVPVNGIIYLVLLTKF